MASKQNKGAGAKKYGRNKIKCGRYKMNRLREKHKVVRIARSSGVKRALEYAKTHEIQGWAATRLKGFEHAKKGS